MLTKMSLIELPTVLLNKITDELDEATYNRLRKCAKYFADTMLNKYLQINTVSNLFKKAYTKAIIKSQYHNDLYQNNICTLLKKINKKLDQQHIYDLSEIYRDTSSFSDNSEIVHFEFCKIYMVMYLTTTNKTDFIHIFDVLHTILDYYNDENIYNWCNMNTVVTTIVCITYILYHIDNDNRELNYKEFMEVYLIYKLYEKSRILLRTLIPLGFTIPETAYSNEMESTESKKSELEYYNKCTKFIVESYGAKTKLTNNIKRLTLLK